ncbi:MAG: hypothetical protein KA059_02355 [Elusimicrobiales bacterium]|nr:hypothetical protein [Elusimicrobiales bacterium]
MPTLLIDETGSFEPDKIGESYIYAVYFEQEINELNQLVSEFIKEKNIPISYLHGFKNNSPKKDEIFDQFKNIFNNYSVIRTNTNFTNIQNDDGNYNFSLRTLLNFFVLKFAKSNKEIDVLLARRCFNISDRKNISREDVEKEEARYQNAMSNNFKEWEEKYKKINNNLKFKLGKFKDYGFYALAIPDIFCWLKVKENLSIVDLKLSHFYENYIRNGFNSALLNEIIYLSKNTFDKELLDSLKSILPEDINQMLIVKNLIDIVGPSISHSFHIQNTEQLNNISGILNTLFGDKDESLKIFNKWKENIINRKKECDINDNSYNEINGLFNKNCFYDNILEKTKFKIDFYTIYAIRKNFLNLNFPESWDKELIDLKDSLELLYKEQEYKDYLLAKIYGTLGQGYALIGKYKEAAQQFYSNLNCLPENISKNKIENYIFTLKWYYKDLKTLELDDKIIPAFDDICNKHLQKQISIKEDPYHTLNILRHYGILEDPFNYKISDILREVGSIDDKVLSFLIKKWSAINIFKYNKNEAINILKNLLSEYNNENNFLLKLLKFNIEKILNKWGEDANSYNLSDLEKQRLNKYSPIKYIINNSFPLANYDKEQIYKLLPFYFS